MEPASFHDPRVEAAFAAFPDSTRDALLGMRALIFQTAAETAGVGPVEETLKWGQPAYLTRETGAGTTIRLGVPKAGGAAIYVHCQTTIIGEGGTSTRTRSGTRADRAIVTERRGGDGGGSRPAADLAGADLSPRDQRARGTARSVACARPEDPAPRAQARSVSAKRDDEHRADQAACCSCPIVPSIRSACATLPPTTGA
jgi:hypothetical protein